MQIIPSLIIEDDIGSNDFEELKNRFEKIAPYLEETGNWVQLDITDGVFVPTRTNLSDEEIRYFTERANVDLHLMVKSPENNLDDWIKTGAKRITFHIEATKKPEEIIEKCRAAGIEVGIALNPETPVAAVISHLSLVNALLFLGVHPGRGGQKFIPEVLDKIKSLPRLPQNVKIGVDGGINAEIAKQLKENGVRIIVVGSYVIRSPNPGSEINLLRNI